MNIYGALHNLNGITKNSYEHEVDFFCNRNKMKICAKASSKLVNLNAKYNYVLAKVIINLVVLAKKLKSHNL